MSTLTPSNQLIDVDGVMALPVVTSHSIDGTFGFCERKFEFAHVYQQMPESGSVGMAAEVGTAMHEAIQAWAAIFLDPKSDRSPVTMDAAVDAGLYALLEWWPWATEELAFKQKKLAATQRSMTKSLKLFYATVEHPFWDDYELATLPDGSVAIEIPWRVIHKSAGTFTDQQGRERVPVTQGKIDFVLRNRRTGHIKVWDLKTTNKAVELMWSAFRFSGQALGYSFILANMLGWDWAEEGIEVTYLTASYVDFGIRPVTYTASPNEVSDYIRTRQAIIERIVSNGRREWWPRRQHGCESFMTACPYLNICGRRDSKFISAWFADEESPFAERTRIYDTLWTLTA